MECPGELNCAPAVYAVQATQAAYEAAGVPPDSARCPITTLLGAACQLALGTLEDVPPGGILEQPKMSRADTLKGLALDRADVGQ